MSLPSDCADSSRMALDTPMSKVSASEPALLPQCTHAYLVPVLDLGVEQAVDEVLCVLGVLRNVEGDLHTRTARAVSILAGRRPQAPTSMYARVRLPNEK